MIASILSCPHCNTLVIEDTAICPGCNAVLKQEQAAIQETVVQLSEKYDGSAEVACRECSAMNRQGLVRCWQCGAFMQEEMERIYLKMQERPSAVISPSEIIVELPTVDDQPEEDEPLEAELVSDSFDDDDFDLADEIIMYEATEVATEEFGGIPLLQYVEEDDSAENSAIEAFEPADENETIQNVAEASTTENDEENEGEDLLQLAVTELRETRRQEIRRKKSVPKGSFLMVGPCGACKIRVQNYHQGKMGQCPKCTLPFIVPTLETPKIKKEDKNTETDIADVQLPAEDHILGTHWHEFTLSKFKPKTQLFAGKGATVDLIRSQDGLIIAWPEKKGLLGSNAKQIAATRSQLAQHILDHKPVSQWSQSRLEVIPTSLIKQMRFLQPVQTTEDFTAGLELFGHGLIAIEIPSLPQPPEDLQAQAAQATQRATASGKFGKKMKPKQTPKPKTPTELPVRCLVLSLTHYRKLQKWLTQWADQQEFLQLENLPLTDEIQTWTCKLTNQTFEALSYGEFYAADPNQNCVTVGWKCQHCPTAISETARVEQKFGGKKSAGLKKINCPGCEQPFGEQPIYHLASVVTPPNIETTKEAASTPPESELANSKTETAPVTESLPADAPPPSTETTAEQSARKNLFSRFRRENKE